MFHIQGFQNTLYHIQKKVVFMQILLPPYKYKNKLQYDYKLTASLCNSFILYCHPGVQRVFQAT
jgi:hypothetical protein